MVHGHSPKKREVDRAGREPTPVELSVKLETELSVCTSETSETPDQSWAETAGWEALDGKRDLASWGMLL